ncbi:MAG: repressor LexA, partial [Oscillospiraceae bacterium]|nr:repressor LexA [Oscillospiraceae bacterium]
FVNLPISLFGRGEFFVFCALGDSMADAGINDGDIVTVLRQDSAEAGDIIAVPDGESGVALRRFGGCDNTAVPEQTNEAVCPESDILGVVKHIIRSLRPREA